VGLLAAVADKLDPDYGIDPDAQYWYCDVEGCEGVPHEGRPYPHARQKQRPPLGYWFLWLILAGRGFGKTRTGGEWLIDQMRDQPDTYWGLVAPTYDDGRDLMVEGESGLEAICNARKIRFTWNRSLGHFILGNAARADLFSSERPESLRGPNLTGAWGDEPATWKYPQKTWENLMFMTRKGRPRITVTGTPKPTKFVRTLVNKAHTVTRGTPYENRSNLAPEWFDNVITPLEGTRLGRQEIEAEILDQIEGALWVPDQIETGRLPRPDELDTVVVALDPSVTNNEDSDECGLTVVGKAGEQAFVLEDWSERMHAERWSARAVEAYHLYQADRIVAEVNNGGDLVEMVIKALDPHIPVRKVNASRGKRTRAEPVAMMYGEPSSPHTWDRARVHHVRSRDLAQLEDQMCTWVPDTGQPSPDRLDSLVWGMTDLLLAPKVRRKLQNPG
jgi:phage terminase large subunit-like protein